MSETVEITGVDFVCIPTGDHERAVAFYAGTLGLPVRKRWGGLPGTEFQAGNLTLAVLDPTAFGRPAAAPISVPVALAVADVAAARGQLEAAGVEFEGETIDSGVCHQAFFRDPDGNQLALHHRYAPGG